MTAPAGVTRAQAARRATIASVVGTTIEWYDFFLYGTAAALVFPRLFFPGFSPAAGVLASFSTQFVGFAARPIGAAIFGHYGDRIGRRTTLMVTLFLMAFGTVLIGVLPTYAAIGITAPILLVVLRTIQGIGVGGEWGGSVLLSMEWGKKSGRGFSASWPQLGVPLGLVLSTGVVRITTGFTGSTGFDSYGWRIPFLLSILLIGVGLFIRLRVVESPEFEVLRKAGRVMKAPLVEVFKRHPKEILLSALLRMSEQAPFYLFITFVLSYGTKNLGLSRNSLLNDTLIAAALGLISIPLFGRLSDRLGRRKVYAAGIVLTALFAFPYFGDAQHQVGRRRAHRDRAEPGDPRRAVRPAGGAHRRELRRRRPLHGGRNGLPAGQRRRRWARAADRGGAAHPLRQLGGHLGLHHRVRRDQWRGALPAAPHGRGAVRRRRRPAGRSHR